ncbi:hypothetical protein BO94DRAFT_499928 [Aspergillus sclerotioniger CBS 115572]|uniref:Uncharacterized protein n=1 Tax=Aspergillus sclerotioniger CBS 115572 TaxID=1450535 RepID=A0A317VJF4_9EURO|nr:hypothetical protein BO94DRAFT_499928 [Aspergillus sclerotioniger CBS 115572]PWY74494.1 hypothetical protein BO94DRAFT_499928 [Aspergillus sclerotioniger CBS 115572]
MDVSLHDIAYFLKVAAGALSLDGSTLYYIVEEDGNLIEDHWTGSEVKDKVFIASEVKSSPSAKYLLNDDTRRVFFPNAENLLQCAEYDDSEEAWSAVSLQSEHPLHMHPTSPLSGCFDNNGDQLIFFQDPSGQLQGIRIERDGECTPVPPLPEFQQSKLVHTAYEADSGAIHLLYIGSGNQIVDLKWVPGNDEWDESIIPGSGFANHAITNFTITSTDESEIGFLAVSATDKVVYIDPQGETSELGQLDKKRFAAVSSEECAAEITRLGVKLVKAAAGTKNK